MYAVTSPERLTIFLQQIGHGLRQSAVLEQRLSRIHRKGQKRPVRVSLLVTDVDRSSGVEELKGRLEVMIGALPDAPVT